MSAAALVPRLWDLVLCDRARRSREEDGVYNLRGVRNFLVADRFPFRPRSLWFFLVLSSPRVGRFPGSVRVINERTEKVVFYQKIEPNFPEAHQRRSFAGAVDCSFSEAGLYTVRVYFFQEEQEDVLKGERPFPVLAEEG
jgi:hypothetical protein